MCIKINYTRTHLQQIYLYALSVLLKLKCTKIIIKYQNVSKYNNILITNVLFIL